jgi:hypothetical protein
MKFGRLFFILLLLEACGNKKNSGDANTVMEVKDFFAIFKPVKLPYTITDTSFMKSTKDTAISADLLSQFVADSVLTNFFGTIKPRIIPAGRVSARKAETYLFVKATSGSKKVAYLLVFDRENKFRASLPLVVSDNDPLTSQTASMDSRYTISLNSQRKKANGEMGYKKDAYVFNNIGVFTLILTETNEDLGARGEVINPLDTLPKKNKLSGDYILDKKNFISFRDGRRTSELRFFVHFEKDKGACKGELRGEANLTSPDVAVYRESGDPCVLEFNFTAKTVSMKEVQGCGNYRDIKCFFDGTYVRKKEKPKATKKK